MAIYHFSAKVIQRSAGRSAVAAAAYRAAERLHDERLARDHDFRAKAGVVHSEVLLPEGAPERWSDRATLWNEVERIERRKDAVLAREIEFALPRELSQAEAIGLARDFVAERFVARGMVADLNVHWTVGADGEAQPHAHVMLTMRGVEGDGFGPKRREWNDKALLLDWRERWAELANARLCELGHDARIDHRSYAAQGIGLEPQHKIGPAGARRAERGEQAERAAEHEAIARRNGERIADDPAVVLDALTRQHSTFTRQDLARFVSRHTDGAEQFRDVLAKVEASPELVRLGQDGRGRDRFTTREMLDIERRMEGAAAELGGRTTHGVALERRQAALAGADGRNGVSPGLGEEQRHAYGHVTRSRDLSVVVGYAGTGKSTMLGVARAAWEAEGYRVRGAALSGIAAEGLEAGSGIRSRTLASLEWAWKDGREGLSGRDVLVVDEAGMIGSRQMERVLSAAASAGAKVVLVGDPEQLQAIEAGAAFRAIAERAGAVEITEVRRQRPEWQREATRELATGRTAAALDRYEAAGMVRGHATQAEAREALVAGWDAERRAAPGQSRVMLAYTRADVAELNRLGRERLRAAGELGPEVRVGTERGERGMAAGDRVMFLRNERGLGAGPGGAGGVAVKNGTLGTVLAVEGERLTVRLDGPGGAGGGAAPMVTFDLSAYGHVDHGYAATVHKAQGATLDRAHVLAGRPMDRHAAYVALTRHRDGVALHWSAEELGDRAGLTRTLGRERAKDTSLHHGEAGPEPARAAAAYAERRGLDPLRPESEIVVRPATEAERWVPTPEPARAEASRPETPRPAPRRGAFAGLRLGVGRAEPEAAGPGRASEPAPEEDALARAVGRYARAWEDARRMARRELPILPHQHRALDAATAAVEAERPGFTREVALTLRDRPTLGGPAAEGARGRRALVAAAEADGARRAEEARREAERQERARQEAERERARTTQAQRDAARARPRSVWRQTEEAGRRAREREAAEASRRQQEAERERSSQRRGPSMGM